MNGWDGSEMSVTSAANKDGVSDAIDTLLGIFWKLPVGGVVPFILTLARAASGVLEEDSEEPDATDRRDVTNMIVTSERHFLEQDCDGYEDDLCPLVIDTGAMSPDHGKLKGEMMYEVDNSVDRDDIQFGDIDIDQHRRSFTDEPGSPSDTLDSIADNSGLHDISLSWSGAMASISPPIMPKSKNGGRLISPSKTRRKCDKIQPLTSQTGEEKYVCPICKHTLSNQHELTRHIRSHNSASAVATVNTCTICGKALSSQSSLDRHMLVHSGERPFRCHFCSMSFTTNGNMHRHMRIHKKDDSGTEPSPVAAASPRLRTKHKLGDDTATDVKTNTDGEPVDKKKCLDSGSVDVKGVVKIENNLSTLPLPSVMTTMDVAPEVKVKQEPMEMQWDAVAVPTDGREYETASEAEMEDEGKELMYENQVEPVACSTYRKLLKMSPMQNFDAFASQKPGQMVSCPVCDKTFFSIYGVEAHLHSNHPCHVVRCATCGSGFRSLAARQRHQLQKHSPWLSRLADCSRSFSAAHVGFHPLSFAAFSCAQFPLIAKAWCERRQRRTSSDTQSFTCQRCSHAFPCYEALHMHTETHAPEIPSTCLKCDCNFPTLAAYDDHMTLHGRDKVMAGYTRMDGGDDNLVQDAVSKDEFLLMLNLKSNGVERSIAASAENGEMKNCLDGIVNDRTVIPKSEIGSGQIISRLHDLMMSPKDAYTDKFAGDDMRKIVMGAMASTSSLRDVAMANGSGCTTPQLKMIDDALERDRKDAGGVLTCNCCDKTFTNIRAYKGHVRAHLGLSPYKCDLCSYSSADRSTLVRHLRTHNGERPFQCLICEFAFTTKANCERHVRKKHDCRTKDDFERAIGYNRNMAAAPLDVKTVQSPETVCKYCGEDFKFFRALKHHLRSHSSCRHKPFVCRLCHNGFSSKANCVRHVQKQHGDIDAAQLERCIHVNENLPIGSVVKRHEGFLDNNDESRSEMSMSPLLGHKLFGRTSIKPSPVYSPSMCVMTPPMALPLSELLSDDADEPLDFSMKASSTDDVNSRDASYSDSVMSVESQDQPIDLTLHARNDPDRVPAAESPVCGNYSRSHPQTTSILARHVSSFGSNMVAATTTRSPLMPQPVHMPMFLPYHHTTMTVALPQPDFGMLRYKKGYQKYFNPVVSRLECPYCSMLFKHGLKLMVHIRSHTNERPYSCPLCNIGFTIKTNLCRHLKTKHPGRFPRLDCGVPGVNAESDDDDDDDDMIMGEANNNVPKLSNGILPNRSPSNSCDSDCDLSSVNRILDATDGIKFEALLRPEDERSMEAEDEDDEEGHQDQNLEASPEPASSSLKVTPPEGPTDVTAIKMEDDQPPTKKKRNSYADSPHKLQCPYCPRAFPWISSLKRHLLTHTGQKPFKCPQCPVTFSTKSNRERHMVRKHGLDIHDPATRQMMDRPYKCHLCVFSSFSTASNLLKHYHEKHEVAEIPDDLVDATTSNGAMPMGAFSVGGRADQMAAVAALCQSIDSQDSVSEISEGHHSAQLEFEEDEDEDETEAEPMEEGLGRKLQELSSPSPLPPTQSDHDNYNIDSITECWHCAARFATRRALLHHMKEHGGAVNLPYKCYLCDASYDARRPILEHTMTSHPSDWAVLHTKSNLGSDISGFLAEMTCAVAEIESEERSGAGGESDYAQRKVHCGLCPKRFWSLQDLRRHMRSHTGERPFKCDLCKKTFTLKHSMLRHRARHTKMGGSASEEESATTTATLDKNRDTKAPKNGHVQMRDANILAMTLATSPSTVGGELKPKLEKSLRSPSSLTLTSARQTTDGDNKSNDSDLLQNLLGVENAAINQMLNSADSAAQLLGVD